MFVPDSPQQVVAHARYRQWLGKTPSMPFGCITNPRRALALAQGVIDERARREREFVRAVRAGATRLQKTWRDDFRNDRSPTVSTIVPCAEDVIDVSDDTFYGLLIIHVQSFHGKGFMPQMRYAFGLSGRGNHHGNFDVIPGTDNRAYDKAVEAGKKWLQRVLEEREREMAQWK